MKNIIFLTFVSMSAFAAAPQYTLQQICVQYGKFGQCSTVPFCQEQTYKAGCYLAKGAPAYVEGLCKLQTMKQGCAIMQSQGNCVWVDQNISTCDAKIESL